MEAGELNMRDWVDITDFDEWDITWVRRKYKCPKYLFAEQYDRNEIRRKILKSHRIKDTIEKVSGCKKPFLLTEFL